MGSELNTLIIAELSAVPCLFLVFGKGTVVCYLDIFDHFGHPN